MIGICVTDEEVKQTASRMDKGGDGTIEWGEFLSFMALELSSARHMDAEIDLAFEVLARQCAVERVAEMKRRLRNGNVGNVESLIAASANRRSTATELAGSSAGGDGSGGGSGGGSGEVEELSRDSKWRDVQDDVHSQRESRESMSHGKEKSRRRRTLTAPVRETDSSEEEKRMRTLIFRMGTQPLPAAQAAQADLLLDTQVLRLILTDAGAPLTDAEMDAFLGVADPHETGSIKLTDLKGLPCFREGGAGGGAGGGQVAARGAPADPTVLYATVPPGVRPGDVLAVEAPDGSVIKAAVPEGCAPGATFGIAGALGRDARGAARPSPARAAGPAPNPAPNPAPSSAARASRSAASATSPGRRRRRTVRRRRLRTCTSTRRR